MVEINSFNKKNVEGVIICRNRGIVEIKLCENGTSHVGLQTYGVSGKRRIVTERKKNNM